MDVALKVTTTTAFIVFYSIAIAGDSLRAQENQSNQPQPRLAVFSISHGGLVSVNVDGSDLKIVAKGVYGAPHWSPDGDNIVFFRDSGNPPINRVYIMNSAGKEQQLLLPRFSHYHITPNWSPDGKRIAFVAQFGPNETDREVCVVNRDGTGLSQLTDDDSTINDNPKWSPGGDRIGFFSYSEGTSRFSEIAPDAPEQPAGEKKFLAGARAMSWSPDGKVIAYAKPTNGGTHIFVASSDGSENRQLTSDGIWNNHPAWSPDGRYIAYIRFDDTEASRRKRDLVVLDILKETHTVLLKESVGSTAGGRPTWLPVPDKKTEK